MKWLIMYFLLILAAGLFNGIIELDYTHGNVMAFTNFMTALSHVKFSINVFATAYALLEVAWNALNIFWKFLTWDYAFLQGGWVFVRIFFIALTTAPLIVQIGLRKLGAEPQ